MAAASASRCDSPRPRSGSMRARLSSVSRSSVASGSSTNTRVRESSAPLISKLGFSVVAPIRVSVPSSDGGRRLSCCALFNRWISSMKRMVPEPPESSRPRAVATISRILGTPSDTALKGTNARALVVATSRASVVFPVPGGPQKIIDPGTPRSMASRNGLPGPSTCVCPTNSSSARGRIRAARGCADGSAKSDSSAPAGGRPRGIRTPTPPAGARRRRSSARPRRTRWP